MPTPLETAIADLSAELATLVQHIDEANSDNSRVIAYLALAKQALESVDELLPRIESSAATTQIAMDLVNQISTQGEPT